MSAERGGGGSTVVIGLGTPLMADDGVGLVVLQRLLEEWSFDENVQLVDGGTWGMSLLPYIDAADRLILLDAIDRGGRPGELVRLDRQELPLFLSMKVSPHQIDLREVLAVAEIRGTLPLETVALGLQPARVELSNRLSPEVECRIPDVVAQACLQLRAWGHDARRVRSPAHA